MIRKFLLLTLLVTGTTNIIAEEIPSIPELLFENGKLLKENAKSVSGLFKRKEKLELSRIRLQQLMDEYPKDFHCAEAAYIIGDIYTDIQLKDYKRAVEYFLKSFEIDSKWPSDTLYRAADITDKKLKDAEKAAHLYGLVLKHGRYEKKRKKAKKRLEKLKELGFGKDTQ